MILKSHDAKRRQFKGIILEVLAVGRQSMVTRISFRAGDDIPVHSHPHEQCGYLLSGKARLICEGHEDIMEPGDTYCIPSNAPHGLHALADGCVVDFFVPVREDYL